MNATDEALVNEAISIVARRQLAIRQERVDLPAVTSPMSWLAKAEKAAREAHANSIEHLNLARYTPASLADRLERGSGPAITEPTAPGWRTTSGRPRCARCEGNGWLEAPRVGSYEFCSPCPSCAPERFKGES